MGLFGFFKDAVKKTKKAVSSVPWNDVVTAVGNAVSHGTSSPIGKVVGNAMTRTAQQTKPKPVQSVAYQAPEPKAPPKGSSISNFRAPIKEWNGQKKGSGDGGFGGDFGGGGGDFSDFGGGLGDASGFGDGSFGAEPMTPQISPEIQAKLDEYNALVTGDLDENTLNALRDRAFKDAKGYNDEQRKYFDELGVNLTKSKDTRIQGMNNDLNKALSSSQEQAFLNALKSQQDAASRGMTGQAIAADSALRSEMGTQRSMAENYGKYDTTKKELLDGFDANMKDISTQKGKLNDTELGNKYLEAYKSDEFDQRKQKAAQIMDYIKTVAPYAMPTANNMLDNMTKVGINNQELDFKRQQLGAQVQKWQSDAQLKEGDLALGWANLDEKMRMTDANIANMQNSMVNNVSKIRLDGFKSQLNSIGSQISRAAKAGDKDLVAELNKKYNAILGNIDSTVKQDLATP